MSHASAAGLVAILLLVSPAAAADIHVPADYASIQQALDASAPGDVVHVAPGTWREALVVPPHALELVGDGGAAATLLDASGTGVSAVFFVSSDEPRVLRGFTVAGGSGTPGAWGWPAGGGVHGETCPFTEVRECVITGNSAFVSWPSLVGEGGGIYLPAGAAYDCVIEGNQAVQGGGVSSTSRVERCVVRDNEALDGGGLFGVGLVLDTLVEDNVAWRHGGGVHGGFLEDWTGVVVRHNTADEGGGLYVSTNGDRTLAGITFFENAATGGGAAAWLHGLSTIFGVSFRIERCAFVGNASGPGELDLVIEGFQINDVELDHCTLVADAIDSPMAALASCVLRDVPDWAAGIGAVTASYSDLPGGWPGPGNFDADPLLAAAEAGDVALLPGSPCIDAGDPADPPDADGTRSDAGAVTFHPWMPVGPGLGGAGGPPELSGDGSLIGGSTTTLTVVGATPQAPLALVLGSYALLAPFKGGTLVPNAQELLGLFTTDAAGSLSLQGAYPPGLPSGHVTLFQAWLPDGSGPQGWGATNGLQGTTR